MVSDRREFPPASEGAEVHVLIVANRFTDHVYDKALSTKLAVTAAMAAKHLGTKSVEFGNLKDEHVTSAQALPIIEKFLWDVQPDEVYGPCSSDLHQDHRAVAEALSLCTRPGIDMPYLRRVYQFLIPTSSLQGMLHYPSIGGWSFMAMSREQWETKVEAMQMYEFTFKKAPHLLSLSGLELCYKLCGGFVGVSYAEPFRIVWEIR